MKKQNINQPTNLHQDILKALKARHHLKFTPQNSLPMLHLVKKNRAKYELDDASGRRGAINQLLDEGLMRLRYVDEAAANLLEWRFIDKKSIKNLTDLEKGITEDAIKSQQREAMKQLATIVWQFEIAYREEAQRVMKQALPQRKRHRLVGIDALVEQVVALLLDAEKTNPVLIYGIGGIGKTSLAETAVSHLINQLSFAKIVWVNVNNAQLTNQQLDLAYLLDVIIQKMGHDHWFSFDAKKRRQQLVYTLKTTEHLIVIDNNEQPIDPQLLIDLNEWSGKSRFLLTSRHTVPADSGWATVPVDQLSLESTAELIQAQALRDGVAPLAEVTKEEIEPIYQVVGGNPLAIKLVVGLMRTRPLSTIIEDIPQAKSKKIEALYKHIYWEAWRALSENGRSLLEMMFSADEMGYDAEDLRDFSTLTGGTLWDAVDELIERSLMEKSDDLENSLYSIHRLTTSFLQTEIIHWPELPEA